MLMPSVLQFAPVQEVVQNSELGERRWFRAIPDADVQLWVGDNDALTGLDFSYRENGSLKLFRWRAGKPPWHGLLDDGESRPLHHKATPVLQQKQEADWQALGDWLEQAKGLPAQLGQQLADVIRLRPTGPVPLD